MGGGPTGRRRASAPLLRRLVEAEGAAARLLRYRDGARRLTNVRHLTELLQEAEAELRMAPAALAVWFSRRRAEARTRDEDTELRIESDEELVRILTVHGAKGLEFPRRLPAVRLGRPEPVPEPG